MGKRKSSTEEKPQAPIQPEAVATLTVPMGSLPDPHDYEGQQAEAGRIGLEALGSGHVQVNLRDPRLARRFYRLRNGLRAVKAELLNGRPVYSAADTIRWMIENLEIQEIPQPDAGANGRAAK